MKRLMYSLVCAAVLLGLAACGGSPAPETAKAAELRAQYDFYDKSVKEIVSGMSVTAEQADDIFVILTSCGLDGAIRNVYKNNSAGDNTYSYYWEGSASTYDTVLNGGVVSEVLNEWGNVIYPPERSTETLNAEAVGNVTALIEGLSADSSRSDYEAAQAAYDFLSNSLKKQIPENLVESLSVYGLSTMTLESAVDSAIESAVATKDNVLIENGIVSIYLKGSDNFTNNMIRGGMLMEAADILEYLQPRSDIDRIALFWSFPLVDVRGNTSEETVMIIQFERDNWQSINFEGFDRDNFAVVADDYFEHAALSN